MTTSFTDLSVVGDGAIRDPRGYDLKTGQLRNRGTVLSYDTFDDGYGGWANHFHYATASNVISRTERQPFAGKYALVVSPSELPISQATNLLGAGAYKRLGFPGPPGVQSFSGMFAIRGGQGTELLTERKYPFSRVWMGMDSQIPEGTGRAFGSVYLKDNGDGTCSWWLKGGKTSSASGATNRPDVEVPDSRMWFTGLNENKANAFYWRLTADTGSILNGGSYYLELQVNNKTFDLRGLTAIPWDLLLNNGSHDMFNGGNNIGIGIARSNINPTFNTVQLLADDLLLTVNDKTGA